MSHPGVPRLSWFQSGMSEDIRQMEGGMDSSETHFFTWNSGHLTWLQMFQGLGIVF